MLPSKRQWKSWSLPNKYTAIGTILTIIFGGLAIILYFFPKQEINQPPILLANSTLRSSPEHLTENDVKSIIKKHDFYDSGASRTIWGNPNGKGFPNQYLLYNNGMVILDNSSGLMWQRDGSLDAMTFPEAQVYIKNLRISNFAGYNDWRLPTLEEVLTLMEPKSPTLLPRHIDPIFGKSPVVLWTGDISDDNKAWVLHLARGECVKLNFDFYGCWVRAVR